MRLFRNTGRVVLFLIAGPILTMVPASLAGSALENRLPEGISKEDIERAWQHRQNRIRTAHFKYKEATTFFAGTFGNTPEGTPLPPEDKIKDFDAEVLLGPDANFRYVNEGPMWSGDDADFDSGVFAAAYNGTKATSGFLDRTHAPYNMGGIGTSPFAHSNARVWPIIWSCRPLVHELGSLDLEEWELLPEISEVDGKRCVVLQKERALDIYQQLFLDIDTEFVPIQVREMLSKTTPVLQMTIHYTNDPRWGPIPISWKCVGLQPNGTITSAFMSTVEEWSINQPTPGGAAAFVLEFSPGTVIRDGRNRQIIVLRRDGTTASYLYRDFEEGRLPRNALSVDPIDPGPWPWFFPLSFVGFVTLVLIAIFVLNRRYYRSQK